MRDSEPWYVTVLREWGTWVRTKGAAEGSGGVVDLERLTELARAQRNPGEHSDPVLAEYLSTEADAQGEMLLVHRYVLLCPKVVRLTARLRYVGILEPTDDPERRDVLRSVLSVGFIAGKRIEMTAQMYFRETPGLSVERIAELSGVSPSAVYKRLNCLHQTVRGELMKAHRDRKNADALSRRLAA